MVGSGSEVEGLKMLGAFVQSGLGAHFGALMPLFFGRRLAERAGEVRMLEATTEADAIVTQAIGDAGVTIVEAIANTWAEQIASGELTPQQALQYHGEMQAARRMENFAAITRVAAEELEGEWVPDQEPDHDFTARFFSGSQDVSNEELQKLWGKLLAGAVEQPGSISVMTLEVLKNLDQRIASAFQRFCSIALVTDNDTRVVSFETSAGQNGLEQYGFPYALLTELQEYGLVSPDLQSEVTYRLEDDHPLSKSLSEHQRMVNFTYRGVRFIFGGISGAPLSDAALRLSGVALSAAGRQLAAVVEDVAVENYTEDLHTFLASKDLRMVRFGDLIELIGE